MDPENVYLWSDPVKMAKVLTGIYERAGFPGLEELFSASNGYLVHHSPKGIFDVTIAFLVPENVDFGILCHTFGILYQLIMPYCVDGGHLGRHLEFYPFCP